MDNIPTMPPTRQDRMALLKTIYQDHRKEHDQYATGLYIRKILTAWGLSLSTRNDYIQTIVIIMEP